MRKTWAVLFYIKFWWRNDENDATQCAKRIDRYVRENHTTSSHALPNYLLLAVNLIFRNYYFCALFLLFLKVAAFCRSRRCVIRISHKSKHPRFAHADSPAPSYIRRINLFVVTRSLASNRLKSIKTQKQKRQNAQNLFAEMLHGSLGGNQVARLPPTIT